MSDELPSPSRLERVSVERTMPAVTTGIAVCFVGIFALCSFSAKALMDRATSAERAEAIAATIAPDVVWRERSRIDHVLLHHAPQAVVLDASDAVLAGLASAQGTERSARRFPIVHEGEQVGTLITPSLVPFQTVLPPWAIVLFGLSAIGMAFFAARFFSRRISRDLNELADFVSTISTETEQRQPLVMVNFTETSRLRAALKQMGQRIERRNHKLEHAAYADASTGLPNAADMVKKLRRVETIATTDHPAAYIHVELCPLGGVSRTASRRRFLVPAATRAAETLNAHFQRGDTDHTPYSINRMGGDHLGILIDHAISRAEISSILRALRRAFVAPFELDGLDITLGLSGGVAMIPEDSDNPEIIIERAELSSKKLDSGDASGFKFYAPRFDRLKEARSKLETELRDGIARNEFRAAFQPKISFETGLITGFEALARWQREGGRTISPAAFIPVAEETGLIRQIGEAVLMQACEMAREWTHAGIDATVAVNVSPLQFEQSRFVDVVIETLRTTGLPPRLLELEITETMAVSDPQRIIDVMRPLQTMGVKLAIDDFGTGHSNLSTLSQLPFSTFKIDRQFVSALETPGHAPAIVEMILAMADTLGLETVAEGVETAAQADFLKRRGCTLGQGYLYSPAVPRADVLAFIRKWNFGAQDAAPLKRAIGQI